MTTIETRRYEMLVRVQNFGEVHRDQFPKDSVGGQALAAVAESVTQLSVHDTSKMSNTGAGKASRTKARKALIAQLEAIAETAQVIAVQISDFDDPFRMPRRRQADHTLLTAGRMFLGDAEVHKSVFVAHKMPETFVDDLKAQVEALQQAVVSRETREDEQTAARAGIARAFEAALNAVRTLDVVVANQFRNDSTMLAVWERDRRIDRPRPVKRVTEVEPAEPATPPATPAPAAAPEPVLPGKAGDKPVEADAALKVAS